VRANAASKLARKGIDLIVVNDVGAPGVGFEHDTNEVVVLGADGTETDVPLTDKRAIARAVLDAVIAAPATPPTQQGAHP
jgi:phosphopantothenoylcysteine decarboxylase / phosphopantothenate---cysteine ligase